jgi:hypothetical protein
MDFHQSQCIARGPRAGLPKPITDIVMDQQSAVWRVTIQLKRDGFQVMASETNASARPSIQVIPNVKTAEMIDCGKADSYLFSRNAKGETLRHWKFALGGVLVTWVEQDKRKEDGHAALA